MSMPPPIPGSPLPRQGNSTLKILAVVLIFVGVPCILGGFFLTTMFKQGVKTLGSNIVPMVSCAYSYEQARDALLQYARDHDGKLPPAETWEDAVRPYFSKLVKDLPPGGKVLDQEFRIKPFPTEGVWGCEVDGKVTTGIAFNQELGGLALTAIKNPGQTILLYEVAKPGRNLNAKYSPAPKSESPKMFGQPRAWITLHVEGEGPYSSQEYSSKSPMFPNVPKSPDVPQVPPEPVPTSEKSPDSGTL